MQGCGELPLQAICPIGTMHAWSPCASLWRIAFWSWGGGAWGKILKWQTQFFAVVIVACIAHMCLAKKFCLDLGVLGENALTNSISCCYVCVTSIAFKQPPTKAKCEDPIRAGMGQPFKQPPTKPKFEDPIRAGMGQPLSVSLKNNVRCSPNPFFLRSVSSQLHIHACVMLESLCQVVENCLCKQYVPLGPCMLGVLVQACGELPLQCLGPCLESLCKVVENRLCKQCPIAWDHACLESLCKVVENCLCKQL